MVFKQNDNNNYNMIINMLNWIMQWMYLDKNYGFILVFTSTTITNNKSAPFFSRISHVWREPEYLDMKFKVTVKLEINAIKMGPQTDQDLLDN